MPSQGPSNPASVVNNDAGGSLTYPWNMPELAGLSDDQYASQNGPGSDTAYLWATGFGFNVPNGSVVEGVVVEIERSASNDFGGSVVDAEVRLVRAGAVAGGDKASPSPWPVVDAYAAYGGASDLWGLGGLLAAEVNAADFGVALKSDALGETGMVDHVRMTVYYRAAGGGGAASGSAFLLRLVAP